MGKDSIKRVDENLRKLQIGQIYDATLNKIKETYCLDLQSLYNDKMVKFSNDEVLEYYAFKDYSGERTDHSVFDIGGGIKGGGPAVSVKAAYNFYNEKAAMIKDNKLTAEIYKVKKVSIRLVNIENGVDNFIDYIDEKSAVKKDYEAIKKTKSASQKKIKIEQFKLRWGTGVITRLKLMGGAVAEISFASKSSDARTNTIHEGELSFESKFVSADGKLTLGNDIKDFSLSVDMKGSVVSFPSEVKSYRDFVEQQVKYIKDYIEKKGSGAAQAPEFNDAGERKPISAKDLNLIEPKDETAEQFLKRVKSRLKKLDDSLDDPDYDDLIAAIGLISGLDDDQSKYKKDNPELITQLNDCKKDFKKGLDKSFAALRPMGEGDKILPAPELAFIDKLSPLMANIKNFKISGDKPENSPKLFNDADMDAMRTFIKVNLKKNEDNPPTT